MSRRTVISSVVAGVLVSGAAAGGLLVYQQRHEATKDRESRAAAEAFARAWSARKLDSPDVRYAGSSPAAVAAGFATATQGLGSGPVSVQVRSFTRSGDVGSAQLAVSWSVAEGVDFAYTDPVVVTRSGDAWAVAGKAGSSLWYPDLNPAGTLTARRTWGARGDILDRSGRPILAVGTVYDVQIDPVRATTAAVTALERVVGEPAGSLLARLRAAQKASARAPIAVVTYREADFRAKEAQLKALAGVIYPPREQPLAVTRTFGQPLLGSYGAVTAEMVTKGKGLYVAGDFAGLSGLQGLYDGVLRGTPGVVVTASTAPGEPLLEKQAVDGVDVRLTLDTTTQTAAETALGGSGAIPSSIVAVDVSTGDLLAVASAPALGLNRALQGRYQPGSTLKVATTYSLLSKGLTPGTSVACPPTVVVDGMTVKNYEGETLGVVPFSQDFAHSCNTAFAGLAAGMGDADVHDAALALGIGAGWDEHLGIPQTFAGSVPAATSKTEKAATAFGQAKTLVSPAALAVMAGSVARGSYIEPALVSSPAVEGADRAPKALDAKVVAQLQQLMRLVVTEGTATVLSSIPGGPVFGKTGTAEYGSKNPPQTRAWFVGWQGDVAFAVLVEEGKSGGGVAAPLAKTFLAALR